MLALVLGACAGEEPPAPVAEEAPAVTGRFGAPYAFSDGPHPDAPAPIPHLEGDTLVAHVRYRGGCEDHAFTLAHDRAADTLRLWLRHDAGGEACSTAVYHTVRAPLPEPPTGPVVLLPPDDAPPLVLR